MSLSIFYNAKTILNCYVPWLRPWMCAYIVSCVGKVCVCVVTFSIITHKA